MEENNNNTTTTISDQLNSLRSILHSDDHLQILPSGDYHQMQIKLDHNIQISCFFDFLNILNKPLTINNLNDLRIIKSSNKCPLDKDQWINICKYFYELIQQSNQSTSLQSVIQSIQDYLVNIMTNNQKSRRKVKKSTKISTEEDPSTLTNRFRHSDLIFNRILHDKTIDRSQVIIGYEDRFTGIHEIPFNEFRRVHEHEYGIPLHRIRHFKINGNLVWDRTKRLDLLTGSQQLNVISNDDSQSLNLVQGLYYFDQSLQQWSECPHIPLTSDDPIMSSSSDTWLPERCHFVTWNILFDYYQSTLIHSQQRYQSILNTLKSVLPDIICLQEVTKTFLNLLLNQLWFQQNNYYLIIMKSIFNTDLEKSYGQLMIMKNFRPRSFSICQLDLSEDDNGKSATTGKAQITKELIIARFGLSAKVTIDLVNLHLHSDLARNSTEKRCQTLNNLFRTMKTHNYMLIGDFNFGDSQSKEQDILSTYENDIHDLWKQVYRLDQNPGFTYDPSRNICAQITSASQLNRRLDRYLIHPLYNLSYSIEDLSMIGIDPIPIDPFNNDDNQRINLSDHYALQLIINFRTRSINHRSALVILPTIDTWSIIDSFCGYYDPSTISLWPSHINLLWPFYNLNDSQDDQEDVLLKLRLLLCQYSSFSIRINEIDSFVENNVSFMKCDEQSTNHLKQLRQQLAQLFSDCLKNSRNIYNPHMTIAQFDTQQEFNQAKPSLILNESFEFPVEYIYILQRPHDNNTTPFHIVHQIPLGPILQPIHSKQSNSVNTILQEFFQTMNLYESNQSYKRKQEKFEKLSSCFEQIFNKDTLHYFTHSFLPYGSFRIGINGEDVNIVFLFNEIKSMNNETTFDETLHQLKHDPNAFNKYIVNLLETQINGNFKDEIIYCMKIEALFPILSILFNDQTKVEIFIQIELNDEQSIQRKPTNDSHPPGYIHGVHDIERLLVHVCSPPIFQHLLTYIRSWARHVGLYGQVYGYLSGYAWAILSAHICHKYLSSIKSLSSIEQFSIDEFFSLVQHFFRTFAQFNWSVDVFCLYPKSYKPITYLGRAPVYQRGSMRIISPSPPFNNAARSTNKSTRHLIIQGFQRVVELFDSINRITTEDKSNALKQILELNNDFPNEKMESIVQITISTENTEEFHSWMGWMRSRLLFFFSDCEETCHYTFQPQSEIEYQSNKNEALYDIAFPIDSTTLQQSRKFTVCLQKFIDQVKSFLNRTNSMNFSLKIISIDDWKFERIKPKAQRINQ